MSIEAKLAAIPGVVSVKAAVSGGTDVFWLETDVPMPGEGEKFFIGFSGEGKEEDYFLTCVSEAVARARENPEATIENFRARKRAQG